MSISIIIISILTAFALLIFAVTYRSTIEWVTGALAKLILVLMVCIGTTIIVLESRDMDRFITIKKWPTTDARIISSRVEGKRAFHPEIVYEYTINAKTFIGTTDMGVPGFGTKANRLNVASTNVIDNPVGKIITVHYDPENPSFSQLRILPVYTSFILLSIGSLLLGAGLWGLLTAFIRKK